MPEVSSDSFRITCNSTGPWEKICRGTGALGTRRPYVKSTLAAFTPPGAITFTLAGPNGPAGVVAVMDASLTTMTFVAAVPPMVTPVAPVNPAPAIVTAVPPVDAPLLGTMDVTVGGVVGAETNCSRFSRKGISLSTFTPVFGGFRRVCAS